MSSESQQQPVASSKQRRKRKDPESRDFVCKCSKSYLSYAAAYTHVKNKHGGDKSYLENISKPDREKLKRGRPKERRQIRINTETQLLSIIEETILEIYEGLKEQEKTNGQKIVLEGNEELKEDEVLREYEMISKRWERQLKIDVLTEDENAYGFQGSLVKKFMEGMKKHFLPPIAAQICWTLACLVDQMSYLNDVKGDGSILHLEMQVGRARDLKESPPDPVRQLWIDHPQIITYLLDALQKWMTTSIKHHSHQ